MVFSVFLGKFFNSTVRQPAQLNKMKNNNITSQQHQITIIPQPKKKWVKPQMEVMKINETAGPLNDGVGIQAS